MNNRLRALIVEDSEDDARLLVRELSHGGFELQFERVASAEAMQTALSRQAWDAVIADYSLPGFSGLEALRLVQQSGLDLPFILVSGTVGEEIAVTAMKAGAHDYMMKANLTRLVPAVRRELAEAQIRQEHKRAEHQLRQLSSAVSQSPNSIIITDPFGNIEYVNPKFTAVTGYTSEEVLGKNPRFLKSGDTTAADYRQLWESITAGQEWHGEFHNRKKNGDLFWEQATISPIFDADGRIIHFLAIKEDITEKKKLEAQFLRAQRMESIGHLAGGIAHDLNNILAPMLMGVELLRDEVKSDHGISMLNMMESNTRRGADIVQQVLMFAKGGESQRMLLQPGHLVKEMGKIIRETFPKSIEVKVDVQKNHWLVSGDATQLHQVLLNLTVNARDAMPQGGTLSLVLEDAFLNWGAVKFISGAKPGPYVILKVADTGTGIPPEVADKIFDPFFTTKGTGKGTGLGLSTVLGIVRSHGGFIQFNSQAGRGTEFKIYLPAKTGRAAAAAPSSLSHPALPQGCGERILIVDDEEAVRTITKEILESNGYQTLTANNGIEAIAAFSENKGQISLVLTDLNMPFMGGLETIAELRRLEPHVAIAIMTGTDIPQQSENSRQAGQHVKLKKPFNAALLLHAVAKALAGKQKNKTAPSS